MTKSEAFYGITRSTVQTMSVLIKKTPPLGNDIGDYESSIIKATTKPALFAASLKSASSAVSKSMKAIIQIIMTALLKKVSLPGKDIL